MNVLETQIAEIWRDALAIETPPEHDVNFFDAGGTSLGLLRVRALLKERLGIELRGIDLFVHTTVEALARHIAQARAS